MRFIRHTFYIAIISVMATVSVFSGNVYGRSLYAITNCQGGTLTAYGIQGDQIVYQINTQIDTWAIGLALDPESETLFVAYDGSDKLVLVDAKTMTQIKSISTTDELAGIVFDVSKQRVYAVSREDRFLYVYLWNPITKTLIQDGEPKILGDADFDAFGVVFDEEEKTLYVTDTTNQVKYYDADDPNFGYLGSIDITVDSNDRETVGIDFYKDSQGNKYLYTGAWMHSTQHEYLVRTDINDVNNPVSTERYLGSNVGAMGVAVDQQTGYVYVTTSNNHIEVYNHTTFPADPCWTDANNLGGPADIIVRGDVSYKPPLLNITKQYQIEPNDPNDSNDCARPADYITYTISYDANYHSVNDVNIIDYLPEEIDIIDVNASDGGTYDTWKRTVTWEIGPLDSNDSGFVTVTIKVDERAEPNGFITNFCEIESDSSYNTAEVNTPVCYWCGDIIYVDVNAPTDYTTGTSWQYAYKDLQNALETACNCECSEIWVADGTYYPTDNPADMDATFNLENNLALYGGFDGNETSLSQRDYLTNETILSGDIDDDNDADISSVVKAVDVNQTARIDGFTIKGAYWESGIYISNSSLTVANNKITKNYYGIHTKGLSSTEILNSSIYSNVDHGIYCDEANEINISDCNISSNSNRGIHSFESPLNITNCLIKDNGTDGIYANSTLADSTIENCIISGNKDDGIYCSSIDEDVDVQIKNNWIYENGADSSGHGIYINVASNTPVTIRNNTIVDNNDSGIKSSWDVDVSIANCIIWNNSDDLDNCSATHSCIKDNDTGQEIIHSDPCFVDDANDNYHIGPNSPCIDKGNTTLITDINETDIDGQPRILDSNEPNKFDPDNLGLVDIGADEWYDFFIDFHSDGIVNFRDFAVLADTWQLEPNDPNYNADCNLTSPNSIDGHDLRVFCDDYWLWKADWFSIEQLQMMRVGSTTYMSSLPESTSATIPYTPTPDQLLKFQPPQLDLEETIKWLEYLWLNDPVLRENINEKQWLEFIKAVEANFKDFLQ